MSKPALFAFLFATGVLMPGTAVGQRVELAMAGPQPHFVAAWAPKKEREAERSAALAGRVSLELAGVSLDEALKALTNQAGLKITYSSAILPAGKRVTIKAGDIAVITALTEMLFRSGLDVVVDQDGTLALMSCKHSAPTREVQDSGTIVGTVTDKATGAPIAAATVLVDGTKWSTTTNGEGSYRIAGVEPGTHTVRARYIGYAVLSASVTVKAEAEVTANFALVKSVQVLDEVVTTGTLVPTEVKALPSPVTVISEEEITLQRPRTIQELLRQAVPGAVSWDYSAHPANADLSVRGATTLVPGGNQMKVFVDGLETSRPVYLLVDPASIERIEVIRGPQAAAIYGSDAIGGVVQVFTKRGENLDRPQLTAQAEVGMVNTPYEGVDDALRQIYSASVRGGGNDVSYHVGANYSRTGNWVPNGEQSSQSSPSVHGGARWARGILSVDVSGRYAVQNNPDVFNPAFLETGFAFYSKPLYSPTQYANLAAGVRLNLNPVPWWQHTVTAGVDQTTNEQTQSRPRLTTPVDTLLRVFNNNWTKRSIAYNNSVQGELGSSALSGSLTTGIDHYFNPETSFGTGSATSTTGTLAGPINAYRLVTKNTGYFAQGQLALHDALFLTAGLRAEQNTGFGDSLGTPVSPRAGVSYAREVGHTALKLRGSWGRAIRPPLPNLRVALGPTVAPNPNLGPERQQGWDAGIDAAFGSRGSLSVTYYNQTAENLIQGVRLPEAPLITRFENVGRVKNMGVEIEGSVSVSFLRLKANYAYSRSRVDDLGPAYTGTLRVGDQMYRIPKHTAGALLTVTPRARTTLTAGAAYVGDFTETDAVALFRCAGGTGPCQPNFNFITAYPGFIKLNASITHEITTGLEGFVSFDNLTNSDAAEGVNFYPVMGRISTVGFRFQH
jgi:outer membrane receptor protein involved in Fe transport